MMQEYATKHYVVLEPRPENPMASNLLKALSPPFIGNESDDRHRKPFAEACYLPSLTPEKGERLKEVEYGTMDCTVISDLTPSVRDGTSVKTVEFYEGDYYYNSNDRLQKLTNSPSPSSEAVVPSDLVGTTVEVDASSQQFDVQSYDHSDCHTIELTPPNSKSVLTVSNTATTANNSTSTKSGMFSPIHREAPCSRRKTVLMVSPKAMRRSSPFRTSNKTFPATPNESPKLPTMATATTNAATLSMKVSPLNLQTSRQLGFRSPGFYQKTADLFATPHTTKSKGRDKVVAFQTHLREEEMGSGGVPQEWLDLYHLRPSKTDGRSDTLAWMRQALALRKEGIEGVQPPSITASGIKRKLDSPNKAVDC